MKDFSIDSSVPVVRHVLAVALLILPIYAGAGNNVQQVEWCKLLLPRLPSVTLNECTSAALLPSGGHSFQKFPILSRHIPAQNRKNDKSPVRIMLLGGIHGDELTAAAIVFKWMQFMPRPIAQQFEWQIVPVVNPDGLLAPKPKRVNANGVDLNRNFPTPNWHQEAPQYWASKTRSDPRRFPGKAPLSEPESRWLNAEIERFKPHLIISVHAPYGVLDFDGPTQPPNRFGRLVLNRVGIYPGSLGNYGGLHKNTPVITIELPNAQSMPANAEIQRIWQDMLTWIYNNVSPEYFQSSPGKQTIQYSAGSTPVKK